jgi:L-iditol 2-dehydrogenase
MDDSRSMTNFAAILKPNVGVFTNPNHDLYVALVSIAADQLNPGPGEVVVQVKATGICGSDVHFQKHGYLGPTMVVRDEHTLGHESSAIVLKVHPSVTELSVGDRVAIEPGVPCHTCDQCLTGHYNGCPDVVFKSTPPVPFATVFDSSCTLCPQDR